jgi:hypothetical protein
MATMVQTIRGFIRRQLSPENQVRESHEQRSQLEHQSRLLAGGKNCGGLDYPTKTRRHGSDASGNASERSRRQPGTVEPEEAMLHSGPFWAE